MEKRNRKPWLFAVLILALYAIVVTIARLVPVKPEIAFYGLRPQIIAEIALQAADPKTGLRGGFRQVILDPDKPLDAQLKALSACALAFAWDGATARLAGGDMQWETNPQDPRNLMPSSIRKIGAKGRAGADASHGSAYAMPILLDHFEIACAIDLLPALGDSREISLERILNVAGGSRSGGHWPIVCAGGQDDNMLLLVTALAEARSGAEGRDRIANALRDGESFESALKSTPLGETLDEIVEWRKGGIIHPEWFRMTLADTRAFLDGGDCDFAFMTLSDHRTIPSKTMSRFASLPFPASAAIKTPRKLTVPAIVAIIPEGKKSDAATMTFLSRLVSAGPQGALSRATGLAPVNSTAETRDIQAYDVRLWAASCESPVPDIANEALADPEAVARLARDIRGYIESNGTGY